MVCGSIRVTSDNNTIERNMIVNNTIWHTGVHLTAGSEYNEIYQVLQVVKTTRL